MKIKKNTSLLWKVISENENAAQMGRKYFLRHTLIYPHIQRIFTASTLRKQPTLKRARYTDVITGHHGKASWNNELPLHTKPNGKNIRQWRHQMLIRMWSNRNSHTLLIGMQNQTVTLKASLVFSYKTKPTLIIWSSNCAPCYFTQGS